ncbi:lipopolysaccharide biosynthesis protein [Bowmanella dokdonensis]
MTFVANTGLAFCNWLLLALISKAFDDKQLGQVVLALSILSPLFLLASFKLRTLLICDRGEQPLLAQYFHARLLANLFLLALLPLIWGKLAPALPFEFLLIIGLYKFSDSWFELHISLLHRLEKFALAAKWQTSRALLTSLTLLVSAWQLDSLSAVLWAWLSITLLLTLGLSLSNRILAEKQLGQSFRPVHHLLNRGWISRSARLYRTHLVLALALASSSLFVYLPNYLLARLQGLEAAGRFAIVSYFLVVGSLLVTSLGQIAQPRLARMVQQAEFSALARLTLSLCLTGFAIGLAGWSLAWLAGDWLLSLLYRSSMAAMQTELCWIMAAAAIRYGYLFVGTSLNAFRAFGVQSVISLAGTLTVGLSCWLLIPTKGTQGAAQAMVIATLLEMSLYLAYLLHFSPRLRSRLA